MRGGWVAFGIVLAIIGAVLLFVPVTTQATQAVSDTNPYAANVTGFSITGTVAFTLTWTSSSVVELTAASCASVDFSAGNPCQGETLLGTQNGTSGSMSFNLKPGAALLIGTPNSPGGSADITLKSSLSTVGSILLVFGGLVFLVGLVLKKKARPAPAPTPAPAP